MPVGLKVVNDNGFTIIDSDYANLALYATGTVTTDTSNDNFSSKFFTVSGLPEVPVIAVAHTAGAFGNVRSFLGGSATLDVCVRAPVGTVVKYWLFGPPSIPSSGVGLRIYNAAGAPVFDAAQKYMRVVGTITGTADGNATASQTFTAGRTYAVIQQSPAAFARNINTGLPQDPKWTLVDMRGIAPINNNVVSWTRDEINQQNWGPTAPPNYNLTATAVIIDVTGY